MPNSAGSRSRANSSRAKQALVYTPAARRCATTCRRRAIGCSRRRGWPTAASWWSIAAMSRRKRAAMPAQRRRGESRSSACCAGRRHRARSFTPRDDTRRQFWFVRDPARDGRGKGLGRRSRRSTSSRRRRSAGGLPKPGPLEVQLRNDHLDYAITWFGLAASWSPCSSLGPLRERYERPRDSARSAIGRTALPCGSALEPLSNGRHRRCPECRELSSKSIA